MNYGLELQAIEVEKERRRRAAQPQTPPPVMPFGMSEAEKPQPATTYVEPSPMILNPEQQRIEDEKRYAANRAAMPSMSAGGEMPSPERQQQNLVGATRERAETAANAVIQEAGEQFTGGLLQPQPKEAAWLEKNPIAGKVAGVAGVAAMFGLPDPLFMAGAKAFKGFKTAVSAWKSGEAKAFTNAVKNALTSTGRLREQNVRAVTEFLQDAKPGATKADAEALLKDYQVNLAKPTTGEVAPLAIPETTPELATTRVSKGWVPYDWTNVNKPLIEKVGRKTPFPSFTPNEPDLPNIAGFFTKDPLVAKRFTGISKHGVVGTFDLKLGKTFEIDAAGKKAGDIQFGTSGQNFRDVVRSGDFDTVIIKNTADEGDVYVSLKSDNIKIIDHGVSQNPDLRTQMDKIKSKRKDKSNVVEEAVKPVTKVSKSRKPSPTTESLSQAALGEKLGNELGKTISPDVLQETGMLREYRGKWQWKISPEGGWLTADTKNGAIEEATKYYSKLPVSEKIPKLVRDEQYNAAKLDELVNRYANRSTESLEAKLKDNAVEAAKLNARYQKLGINQYGTQRTAGITSQLDGLSTENYEIKQVLDARKPAIPSPKPAMEGKQLPSDIAIANFDKAHRALVEKALSNGKEVPDDVLSMYPDLAAKYAPKTPAAKGKEAWEMTKQEGKQAVGWTSDIKSRPYHEPVKYADKTLVRDEGIEADVNGFFQNFKQPSESQVREAMLWTAEDSNNGIRLSYKSGGGSMSDRDFVSSLAIQEGDKWNVVIKKQGHSLDEVRIDDRTIGEARSELSTPEEQLLKRQENIATGIPYASFLASKNPAHVADLIDRLKTGDYTNTELKQISDNIRQRVTSDKDLGKRGTEMLKVADAIDPDLANPPSTSVELGALGTKPPEPQVLGSSTHARERAGLLEPQSSEPIKKSHIIDYFQKELDVPIRFGKLHSMINSGKYAGVYKPQSEMIRVKQWGNLRTIGHEVGHAVSDKYMSGFRTLGKEVPGYDELVAKGKDIYPTRSESKKWFAEEGLAEFMTEWLSNSTPTVAAPTFAKHFEQLLTKNPDLAKKLEGGRKLVTGWYEQGALARVNAMVDRSPVSLAKAGMSLKKSIARFQDLWTNPGATVELFESEARGLPKSAITDPMIVRPSESPSQLHWALRMTASAKARDYVLNGIRDAKGNIVGNSLREVLKSVAKDSDNFFNYAVARRSVDLHGRGINPGLDIEDAKYLVGKLETPEFKKTLDDLTEWQNKVLDYLVDAGGLSKEAKDAIRTLNPVYVPFKRVMDEVGGVGVGRKLADVPQAVGRIKGSGREIVDPLESIIAQTARIISTADRVRIGRAIVDLAEKTKGMGKWVDKVDLPAELTRVSLDQIERQLKEAGVDIAGSDLEQVLNVYTNTTRSIPRENVVTFWRNGKREAYQLDKNLYEAMTAIDPISGSALMRILGAPARLVRMAATGINPEFALGTNPVRDAMTFAFQGKFAKGAPWEIAGELLKKIRPTDTSKLYGASGANMSQMLGLDRKSLREAISEVLANDAKSKALNVVKHPIEFARDLLSITESAPRTAEFEAAFKKLLKKYGNAEDAMIGATIAAKDVTVDFSRIGRYAQHVNSLVPFFNAWIQGESKFYRALRSNPKRSAIAGLATTAITTTIWKDQHNEQWYRELPDWRKYGFWNFHIGDYADGKPIIFSLPIPFEWGIVFKALPEAMLNRYADKDPAALKEFLTQAWQRSTPSVIPAFASPVLENWTNYDFFRGKELVPPYMKENKLPQDQAFASTPQTYRKIGELLGYSPIGVQNIVEGYTSSLTTKIVRGVEGIGKTEKPESQQLSDIPVAGRFFTRQPSDEERQRSLEYEQKEIRQRAILLEEKGDSKGAEKLQEQFAFKHPDSVPKDWKISEGLQARIKNKAKDLFAKDPNSSEAKQLLASWNQSQKSDINKISIVETQDAVKSSARDKLIDEGVEAMRVKQETGDSKAWDAFMVKKAQWNKTHSPSEDIKPTPYFEMRVKSAQKRKEKKSEEHGKNLAKDLALTP